MARAAHAFLLALRDLPNPRVLRVLAQSLALTLLLLAAVGAAIFFVARWALAHWKWLEGAQLDMAGVLIVLLIIAGSWLLFRAVAIVVIGLFADGIVAGVGGRHYPDRKSVVWGKGVSVRVDYGVRRVLQKKN